MTRKLLPFPGAESVLDPLTLESEMRIAALRAADRAAAAAAQGPAPQPTESWDPVADRLALDTDPPRPRSPLSAITVGSFVASIRQAAQQLRQVPSVAAQARAADTLPALISPAEARLLLLLGGSGRIDRYGFRHFDNPALTPDPTAFGPPTLYPPLDPNDQALNWPGPSVPPWSGPTASFPAIQPVSNPAAPPAGSGGSQDAQANPGTTDLAALASQPVVQLPADGSGGGLLDQLLGIGSAEAQGIGSGRGRGVIRVGPGGNELTPIDEINLDSYNAGLRELRSIEPNNRQLSGSISPPNWVPNRNDVEAIWGEVAAAKIRAQCRPYEDLTEELAGTEWQAHHLNPNAAYGSVIPRPAGVAVPLRGNAFTDIGAPHYEAHRSLEEFWSPFRPGGIREYKFPTNAELGDAVRQSLIDAGHTSDLAARLSQRAADQRAAYGLAPQDPVPRVPGRMGQAKDQ